MRRILKVRAERESATNTCRFDNQEYEVAGFENDRAPSTFKDYADLTSDISKPAGLIRTAGRGISVPEKHLLVEQLVDQPFEELSDEDYSKQLCSVRPFRQTTDLCRAGSSGSTEERSSAGAGVRRGRRSLRDAADIAVLRYELEELIADDKEMAYAAEQAGALEEISTYMRLLAERGTTAQLSDGTTISVPKSEAPAYFEWTLWRAFLAINSLQNKPYEARRFKIDQDFLPYWVCAWRRS